MGRDGVIGAFEELVLLAVARGEGSAYGMTVRRDIEANSGRSVAIGAVYTTLDRLEAKGLVASELREGDEVRRGRARRFFRLEPAAIGVLARAREVRASMWSGIDLDALAAMLEADS